ncbi:MAG: hypothetical protein GWP41_02735, partial [Planctomycetia bacterium]|nr:hypothetical protein [Planctomycetia bacterium]NCF99943.1 hypothetical protein [Planctomycetia bacterium]
MENKRVIEYSKSLRMRLCLLLLSFSVVGLLVLGVPEHVAALSQDPIVQQDPPATDDLLEDDMLEDDML